jgi:hypothetical protein
MRELRSYGFVRGVLGDWHPYRSSHTFRVQGSLIDGLCVAKVGPHHIEMLLDDCGAAPFPVP